MSPRRGTRRRSPLRQAVLALLVLGPLFVGGATTAWALWAFDARPVAEAGAVVTVQIPRGSSGREIVERLATVGLAPSPQLTYWALRMGGTLHRVQAGVHSLPANASARELIELLRLPAARAQVELTLIPGETVWQAAERIERLGIGTAEEVLARAADHSYVVERLGLPAGPPRQPRPDGVQATYLEGFLYPDTYFLAADATVDDAIEAATRQFKSVWGQLSGRRTSDLDALRERFGVGVRELVVLASLVEEEAQDPSERPRIAGVFFNRLAVPMRLQTDPTLRYHPARLDRPPTPTDRRDRSNPYNTYAFDGLPPGPICSPGAGALAAALTPERHEFVFFVARRDARGSHEFAVTLAEHEANIDRYLR